MHEAIHKTPTFVVHVDDKIKSALTEVFQLEKRQRTEASELIFLSEC